MAGASWSWQGQDFLLSLGHSSSTGELKSPESYSSRKGLRVCSDVTVPSSQANQRPALGL